MKVNITHFCAPSLLWWKIKSKWQSTSTQQLQVQTKAKKKKVEGRTFPLSAFRWRACPGSSWVSPRLPQKSRKRANLFQENQEGDIGAQRGRQRALAGDQVETFGCLDGTLLPPGCVLHADSSCTVIRDHFSVAGGGKRHTRTFQWGILSLQTTVVA